MEIQELADTLEAVLFASGEAVEGKRLCQALDTDITSLESAAALLDEKYAGEIFMMDSMRDTAEAGQRISAGYKGSLRTAYKSGAGDKTQLGTFARCNGSTHDSCLQSARNKGFCGKRSRSGFFGRGKFSGGKGTALRSGQAGSSRQTHSLRNYREFSQSIQAFEP